MSEFDVLPRRLSYAAIAARRGPGGAAILSLPNDTASEIFVSIEEFCVYFPFFLDFGPAALNRLFRFCEFVTRLLADRATDPRRVVLVSGSHMHRRANAVYLISAYLMLNHARSPEDALRVFAGASPPIAPWHDASPGVDPFHLSSLDVLRGIHRAQMHGFFSFSEFDVEQYERFEQVQNGDMNWLVPGRFLAFAGPHDPGFGSDVEAGYHVTSTEELIPVFRDFGITSVVRLNKKYYDERRFTAAKMAHLDLYFLDGSNPPEPILQRFLRFAEETDGAIAVHCKAGLGRTGSCIGAYLMKHYGFSAREAIGWMRVCRPGSVIGPQQQYLESIESRMWEEGALFRRSRRLPQPVASSLLARLQNSSASAPTPVREPAAFKARTLYQLPTSPIAAEAEPSSRSGGGHASMFSTSESLRQALGGGSSRSFAPSISLSSARAGPGSLASLRVAAGAPRFAAGGAAAPPADEEGRPGQGEQLRSAKNRGNR